MPGPRIAQKKMNVTMAAMTHAQLRVSGGIWRELAGNQSPLNQEPIHVKPDVPPKEAAAAEKATRNIPAGFGRAEMQRKMEPEK